MSTTLRRVVGATIALIGLVLAVVGGWFVSHLGSSGTATLTGSPGTQVVVLEPDVLNRLDSPVLVTAESAGQEVWMGAARPSDAAGFVDDRTAARVSEVSVRDWALHFESSGEREPVAPSRVDMWQATTSGSGKAEVRVDQADAPQSLVVAAPKGQTIDAVTLQVSDGGWFTTALVALIAGLVLVAGGLALAFSDVLRAQLRRRRSTSEENS